MVKKKPTAVNILGVPFKIEYKPLRTTNADDTWGETFGLERRLEIDESIQGPDLESTLLHELIHGILHVSGVSGLLSHKVEESLVTALENGLHPHYRRR